MYAEFYDGELNSAWILRAAELSPSSLVPPFQQGLGWKGTTLLEGDNTAGRGQHCWKGTTLLEGDNFAARRIHAEFNSPS